MAKRDLDYVIDYIRSASDQLKRASGCANAAGDKSGQQKIDKLNEKVSEVQKDFEKLQEKK